MLTHAVEQRGEGQVVRHACHGVAGMLWGGTHQHSRGSRLLTPSACSLPLLLLLILVILLLLPLLATDPWLRLLLPARLSFQPLGCRWWQASMRA